MKWTPSGIALFVAAVFFQPALAKKPVDLDLPISVDLTGDVTGDGGMVVGATRQQRKGKLSVKIVVHQFDLEVAFAQSLDFFPGKFGDPDGANCFHMSDTSAASFELFDDGTATMSAFPDYFTADPESLEIQKYFLSLEGTHTLDLVTDFPVNGAFSPVTVDFNFIEIATEGRGQNRRRSCRGEFSVDDPEADFMGASVTFSRP